MAHGLEASSVPPECHIKYSVRRITTRAGYIFGTLGTHLLDAGQDFTVLELYFDVWLLTQLRTQPLIYRSNGMCPLNPRVTLRKGTWEASRPFSISKSFPFDSTIPPASYLCPDRYSFVRGCPMEKPMVSSILSNGFSKRHTA